MYQPVLPARCEFGMELLVRPSWTTRVAGPKCRERRRLRKKRKALRPIQSVPGGTAIMSGFLLKFETCIIFFRVTFSRPGGTHG
jgi:hypothetical protein